MIKLRKIRVDRLIISGIIYRLHIIAIQSIFLYIITYLTTGQWLWQWAIGISLLWNLINTALYYNFHYWFYRLCKLGRGNK